MASGTSMPLGEDVFVEDELECRREGEVSGGVEVERHIAEREGELKRFGVVQVHEVIQPVGQRTVQRVVRPWQCVDAQLEEGLEV